MTRITGNQISTEVDQDAITFYTGGVERGRITGTTNTFSEGVIGTSYLIASHEATAAVSANASGATAYFSWFYQAPPDGVVGSDLEIDGADDTKINVLTTGLYQITAAPSISTVGDALCEGSFPIIDIDLGSEINFTTFSATQAEQTDGSGVNRLSMVIWPFDDGDVIRIGARINTPGTGARWGTTGEGNCLQIVRLA